MSGLVWQLRTAGTVLPVRTEPGSEVTDAVVEVEMTGLDRARACWRGGEASLEVDRDVREAIVKRPNGLWILDLEADGRGTLSPFAPPRVVQLEGAVPVRVDPGLADALAAARLRVGGDLCREATLPLAAGRVAIVGQRAIAAMDETDARSITWWLPDGSALELRLEDEAGRSWLRLCAFVSARDARTANCGPNALVRLGRQASVPIVVGDKDTAAASEVAAFRPARAATFDAWARYAALVRVERADRELARMKAPLPFENAVARGRNWVADSRVDEATLVAWLGSDLREGRSAEVGQSAALEDDDDVKLVIKRMKVTSRATAELTIETRGQTRRLPPSGRIVARENRGDKVRDQRERAALDLLSRGSAAADRLVELLADPSTATPPVVRPLPRPVGRLDEHQRDAVARIVGCVDLVAIQGPPGTGKSEVIAEALRQIAALPRRDGRAPRVLVSSVQNEAVSNVVDRIGDADGLLVRVVQRQGVAEDEVVAFAQRVHEGRDRVVARLSERLAGNDIVARLQRVRDLEAAVSEVRALLATAEAPERVATRLEEIEDRGLLSSLLVDEARRLAAELRKRPAPALLSSAPTRPSRPEDVAAWWARAEADWPVEHRASLGAAVAALVEALAESSEARRRLFVARHWAAVSRHLAALPMPGPPIQAAPATTAAEHLDQVDAWVASALASLRQMRMFVERSPDAVALRFLQALQEDTHAWRTIVDRHGSAVAATCSMSALAAREAGDTFDWVIIDEAGRASPFELLVPMVQGARVVLIGDHRQLPPMVDDALVRKVEEREALPVDLRFTSLFEEVFSRLPSPCRARLAVQYRMHGAIGELVNRLFYLPHRESVASWFTGDRASERAPRFDVFGRAPIGWLDVPGHERHTEENPREVAAVMEVLLRYAGLGCPDNYVAVIVPYRLQRERLERMIRAEPAVRRVAQVRTIDQVQGRDYEVVLLCTTRTDGRPGFLASPNRVNVAISRAKRQLVVLGHRARFRDSQVVRQNAPHLQDLATLLPEVTP